MIIRYIRAWIHKYILHIKSPSAYMAGWEYEWDLITKGGWKVRIVNECETKG